MIVAHDLEALQQALFEFMQEGKRIALVPTMGALHDGHASLITEALEHADIAVVSIFVNPRQFGASEDFSKYPRTLDDDVKTAESAGASIVYVPNADDIYPEGFVTSVSVGETGKILCGKFRPGHFDGVATIVTKLLLQIMPHVAIFGEKDYQQLQVIERVVCDLDIPVEIISAQTMREADGLAMSSRNRYLSASERKTAPLLYRTLLRVFEELKQNEAEAVLKAAIEDLMKNGFEVDYLELCDGTTLQPIFALSDNARLLVAARLGTTRLIDNIDVSI